MANYTEEACRRRRTEALAPRTHDVRSELVAEIAEYLAVAPEDVERSLDNAQQRFTEEWREKVADPADEHAVIRFYNESETEIFDLAAWHGSDTIHCRSVMCTDIARDAGSRRVLDYGSGIGSDALVFAKAGFDVTIADVSTPLLAFARWRLRKHGFEVEAIDLKSQRLPERAFDAAICFDVLEHIPRPGRTLRAIRRALTPTGLLFVHAPFGADPERPMHLVHTDPVSPKIRVIGFNWRDDLERLFPQWLWAPRVAERLEVNALDRLGYYIHDIWMPGPAAQRVARVYRRFRRRRHAAETGTTPQQSGSAAA